MRRLTTALTLCALALAASSRAGSISAGTSHVLVKDDSGHVWAFGDNTAGKLGNGTTTDSPLPVQVSTISDVVSVAAGSGHSLALTSSGVVYAWGSGSSGALGRGNTQNSTVPVVVPGLPAISGIAAGAQLSVAWTADHRLFVWGNGSSGQIGDGTTSQRTSPYEVTGVSVEKAAAGATHVLVITTTGGLKVFGRNNQYQLGLGDTTNRTTPTDLPGLSNVTDIEASDNASFAIADGQVYSWGNSTYGLLAQGASYTATAPTAIAGLTSAIAVNGGTTHTLFLATGGIARGAGRNGDGEVGDGTTAKRTTPVTIDVPDVTEIAAGNAFSVLRTSTGEIYTFGLNGSGQLGNGTTTDNTTPRSIGRIGSSGWTMNPPSFTPTPGLIDQGASVSLSCSPAPCSIKFSLDGTDPGTLYGGAITVNQDVTIRARASRTGWADSSIAAGTYPLSAGTLGAVEMSPSPGSQPDPTSVALSGSFPAGTEIRYTTSTTGAAPDPTSASALYTAPIPLVAGTTSIKARAFHPDWWPGAVSAGTYQLTVNTPTITPPGGAVSLRQIVTVACDTPGATVTYTIDGTEPLATSPALPADGKLVLLAPTTLKVKGWKTDYAPSATASVEFTLSGSIGLKVGGGNKSYVVRPDRTVWGWGSYADVVGDAYTDNADRLTPVEVSALSEVVEISSSNSHVLALRKDGSVWAFGLNGQGRVGDGTTVKVTTAKSIGLSSIVAVAAGYTHSLALGVDGTVWAFGANDFGQLGLAATTSQLVPVQVPNLSNVYAIEASEGFSVFLLQDGTVWALGKNTVGQLGNGSTSNASVPVQVVDAFGNPITGIAQISAGREHVLALTSTGTVWVWGQNAAGQLGVGNTTSSTVARQVTALSGITAVAAGGRHSLAVRGDGVLFTWGRNQQAALGLGDTTNRTTPTVVPSLSAVAHAAGGEDHSMVLTTDGTLYTFGRSNLGQLGNGGVVTATTPQRISDPGVVFLTIAPTITPGAGAYTDAQSVSLSTATRGAEVRYTLDGGVPTSSSSVYTSSIPVSSTTQVRARAYRTSFAESAEVSALFKYVTPVSISPSSGEYSESVVVSLTPGPTGSLVRYTQDGSDPSSESPLYSAPLSIAGPTVLKARAFDGSDAGPVSTAVYAFRVADPTIEATNASGPITLATLTPGATIHYTMSGWGAPADPTTFDPGVPSGTAIPLNGATYVKARAVRTGYTDSQVATREFLPGSLIVFPGGGSYSGEQVVSIYTAEQDPDAVIRFTLDGSEPTSDSASYVRPIVVSGSLTLKARALRGDVPMSPTATHAYVIASIPGAPELRPASAMGATGATLGVTCPDPALDVRYTSTGNAPESTDTVVPCGGELSFARSGAVKVRGWIAGNASDSRTGHVLVTGSVAAGQDHTLALSSDGHVWAWGRNNSRQVRVDTTANQTTPYLVPQLSNIRAIAAGRGHSLALDSNGEVWAWGSNGGTLVRSVMSGVRAIAAREELSYAVMVDGSVKMWNGAGLVGGVSTLVGVSDVVAIAAGSGHRLFLRNDGTVLGWGSNAFGQAGQSPSASVGVPTRIPGLADVRKIFAAGNYSFALTGSATASGTLYSWGEDQSGQLGNGPDADSTHVPTAILKSIIDVSAGAHVLAIRADGTLMSWGSGSNGVLGDGSVSASETPADAASLGRIVAVAAGGSHSVAVLGNGSVTTWGASTYGQLGRIAGAGGDPGEVALSLFSGSWILDDPDDDGLPNLAEYGFMTDPWDADTNDNGILDAVETEVEGDAVSLDSDGDGLSNWLERTRGTDPDRRDTDGDGVIDGRDAFPLDPSRSESVTDPSDQTPPTIDIIAPAGAQLITSQP